MGGVSSKSGTKADRIFANTLPWTFDFCQGPQRHGTFLPKTWDFLLKWFWPAWAESIASFTSDGYGGHKQMAQTWSPRHRKQCVWSCHYRLPAALPPSLCKSQLCVCNIAGLSGIQMASPCTWMAPETWATWRVLFPPCDLHLEALKRHSCPSTHWI